MTANTTTEAAVSYTDLLRNNRNFRFLWFGQIVSLLGDWFNLVASAALVGLLTQSGLAVGSLFVVRMLAPFLVSPIAGVAADRYNRKYILIAADLIRAAVVLGFLLVRDPGDVWLLYTLTALQMAMSGFFDPAHTSILPDIAKPRELGAVNALSSATWSVMLALGAALGGLFSGTFGMYPAFVLDTFTFLLSAALLAQIRMPAKLASAAADKTVAAAVRQYFDGLRYLRAHRDILVVALQKGHHGALLGNRLPGYPGRDRPAGLYRRRGRRHQPGPDVWPHRRRLRPWPHPGAQTDRRRSPVVERSDCIRLSHRHCRHYGDRAPLEPGNGSSGLSRALYRQRHHLGLLNPPAPPNGPDEVRGRVFASDFMFFYLGSALSSSVIGAALDTSLTISAIIWTMAAISIVPTVLWTLWVMKGRRDVAENLRFAIALV